MPIKAHLSRACFSQDQIDMMTAAFERSLALLGLKDRNDPLVTLIAKRVIELAKHGDADSGVIAGKILLEYQPAHSLQDESSCRSSDSGSQSG